MFCIRIVGSLWSRVSLFHDNVFVVKRLGPARLQPQPLPGSLTPLPILCSSCPDIYSVPLTSQQGFWAGLFRRLFLQAPCVRGLLMVPDLVSLSPPQEGLKELHTGTISCPYLLILGSSSGSLQHLSPSAAVFLISLCIDFSSAPKRICLRRAVVLPFLLTPVSPES